MPTTGIAKTHYKPAPDKILWGPGGRKLQFSHGIIVPSDGDLFNFYYKVQVIFPSGKHVEIGLPSDTAIDGDDAEGRNRDRHSLIKDAATNHNWSLALWSIDGKYIVLMGYQYLEGRWDFRNAYYLAAYDTETGDSPLFKGGIRPNVGTLETHNFIQWSPEKSGVAILQGRGAYPNIEATRVR